MPCGRQYELLLDPIRDTVRNVTEVGAFTGHSAAMWSDYFSHAQIFTVDLAPRVTQKQFAAAGCCGGWQQSGIRLLQAPQGYSGGRTACTCV